MEGIKYVQKNRLVVDTESSTENAPLKAEGSNAIVTENEIWFDPSIIDVSDLHIEEELGKWNASSHTVGQYPPNILYEYSSKANSDLRNQYGFVCGVISYRTSEYVTRRQDELNEDTDFVFYEGDDKFWSLLNARLDEDFQSPLILSSWYYASSSSIYYTSIPDVVGWAVAAGESLYPSTNAGMRTNEFQQYITGENVAKLRFYNHTMILAPGQLYNTYQYNTESGAYQDMNIYSFKPNFTGNNGVLPVGLVMLRDIVYKASQPQKNLNNFGIYGFTIVMPFFIEPSQIVRGFSLGKEMFVVGNGLKAEVFFAISTTGLTQNYKLCGLSNRNLGNGQPGRLDVLFKGGNGELLIGNTQWEVVSESNTVLNCTNVYHDIVDFSVPGNTNGVFYFNKSITYDMGVKYLVFGMRPYDINGNGKEYPPKENLYGTDTSYLGNYALIDISDKKFYLL